jgi:hypothetical protein
MLVDIVDDELADEQWHQAAMTSLHALLRPLL